MVIRLRLRGQLRRWYETIATLILLSVMLLCAAPSVQAEQGRKLEWQYHVVGTPAFPGPPKMQEPGFRHPVPLEVQLPEKCLCQKGQIYGEFEALLSASGRVEEVHSHHLPIAGTFCQQQCVLSVVRGWLFQPATFEGKPTPVYMWIGVDESEQ